VIKGSIEQRVGRRPILDRPGKEMSKMIGAGAEEGRADQPPVAGRRV
jgi:hypothetical protein